MKRTWAIGDIHGESGLLFDLLSKIPKQDNLIFMGDMIDRGPNSKDVIDEVRKQCDSGRAIAMLGNHELFAIEKDKPHGMDVWLIPCNGGQRTLDSYGGDIPGDVIDWMKKLPTERIIDDIYICHAPYSKTETKYEKVWRYIEFQREPKAVSPHKFAICGHIHRLQEGLYSPRIYERYAFIDTGAGCYYKAPLTAMEIHTKEFLMAWPEI